MYYQSTRGGQKLYNGFEALKLGLAPDGGLFIPKDGFVPALPIDGLEKLTEPEVAEIILALYFPEFRKDELSHMVRRAYYGRFDSNDDLTPLKKVGDRWVLELYHGPTSAFKDVALCMLPELISNAKRDTGSSEKTVILTATSGDTGKAALEGFHDVEGIQIIVFYPDNGVSAIQKAQMTTQEGRNVAVCAVKGNFDDAQNGVKEIFASCSSSDELKNRKATLSSANSINIGRLVPQIVYYYHAYLELLRRGVISAGEQVDFTVPTGNFGDILAGYMAKKMGLPVGKLICASNRNNVLTDFFNTGVYSKNRKFYKTSSPSMDILISSNLERLLYLCYRDTNEVARLMEELKTKGKYEISVEARNRIGLTFSAGFCSEEQTEKTIGEVFSQRGYLMDTHTAVAWHVSEAFISPERPMVVLSTASPYKFPDTVLKALGDTGCRAEFDAIDQLERVSGVKAPTALSELRNKTVLHSDVIDKKDMRTYVLSKIKS